MVWLVSRRLWLLAGAVVLSVLALLNTDAVRTIPGFGAAIVLLWLAFPLAVIARVLALRRPRSH